MWEIGGWMIYHPWLYGVAIKEHFFNRDTKLEPHEEEAVGWIAWAFALPFFAVTVVVALFYQVESSLTFYMFITSYLVGVFFVGATTLIGYFIDLRAVEQIFEGSGVVAELISIQNSKSWGILLEITNIFVNLGLGVCFGVMLKSRFFFGFYFFNK